VTDQILRMTFLAAAAGWFYGALGIFFSALVRNRWSAMSLVASVMVLLYLVPFTIAMSRGSGGPGGPADNLFYLSPMVGAIDIAETAPVRSQLKFASLLGGAAPIDRVSSILFGVGGLILLFAAHRIHIMRERRLQSEVTPSGE
jgi:ABC-type transport system involved in multi-copper enzyme maturation permease subunit